MRAATTSGIGPMSRLVVREVARPVPGPDEVLVEVHASSVNPKDWKLNQNLSSLTPRLGPLSNFHIIGDDLAGICVETGANVKGIAAGDEVYGMDMRLRTAACADYAVISTRRIARKPANLDFGQAATVPLAALTALQAFRKGELCPGTRALIIGASGGVGTFAVQIAKALGADVTGVCSGRNLALVRELGADQVIDYTAEDYRQRNEVYDLVFDATSYETPAGCAPLLREGGIFVSTGGHAVAYLGMLRARLALHSSRRARFVFVESWTRDLDTLTGLIEAGKVTPVIDSSYPLERIDEAYARSRSGRARGKIVIQVRD